MSSATENYGRLKLLSERLVHPAAENVLETYLRSEKVTFHRFLETHKHHIMHCYRSKTSCCSTQANCNYPRAQPLSKRQWNFLYTEEQSNSCTKPDCVCNVVTTCKKFRKLNISVIFFLLTEFSMVDSLKMVAVKKLKSFIQEMQDITTGIVSYADFQTKWNTVTDSLIVLGVTQEDINMIKRLIINRTPSPTTIYHRVIMGKTHYNFLRRV